MKWWKYIAALVMAVTVWTPVRAEEAEEAVADSVATEQAADGVVTEDAVADTDTTEQGLDVQEVIFGHMSDAYEWHITNVGDKSISIPLPVIVRSKTSGWHVFSSAKVEHGEQYEGFYVSQDSGKIVERNAAGEEIRPLDLSITKNVLAMMISSALLIFLILWTARWYRRHDAVNEAPKGLAAFMEPIIMMIDTGVAKDSIGEDYQKFSPYLCTVFLWILLNNLLGIVPFFPGGANVTGNIAVTCVLGFFTFFMINLFGTKHYFKDIFWPDVPLMLKFPFPLLPIIEVFSTLMKPLTLMIRLFANMLAGHIIAISLVCIIFVFAKYNAVLFGSMTVVSVLFGVFMDLLEVLVAFLQAYVFTILSAVFIGMARQKEA